MTQRQQYSYTPGHSDDSDMILRLATKAQLTAAAKGGR